MEGVLYGSLPVVVQRREQSSKHVQEMLQKKPKAWTGQAQDRGLVEKGGKAGQRSGGAQELHDNSVWDTLSLEEALTSTERMPQPPSIQILTCILHKCRTEKKLAYTKRLYACMCKSGLEDHTSLGNYVVPILVQVGSMCDAQLVFDKLVDRNVYSWTSLLWGYIECGDSKHAVNLYQEMQEESVHPSKYTFVAILKACATLKDIERGRQIHFEIARKGLERDLFVGNTMVDMYAKCGLLAEAHDTFDKLPVQDKVSWNALITGYAENGFGDKALNCFYQMQLEGLSPDAVTFICSLKACGSIGAIRKGREIHAEISRIGLVRDLSVGNTLVDMYAKCGLLAEAQESFVKLPVRDVVSWTALVAGYAEHDLGEEALNCLEQMQMVGISLDAVTFVWSLKACGSIEAIGKGREIHAEIARKNLERHLIVGNTLVDMYAKCGSLTEAQEAFDKLLVRDEVSWNALMAGYAKHGHGEDSLNCLEQMQMAGYSPDAVTFVCTLKACGSFGAISKGREIHAEIARKGLERHLSVANTLVDMYAKCSSLAEAVEAFDKLPLRDIVSWTALIAGYAEEGLGEEALNCLEQMQLKDLSPNAVTCACSLKACGSIGAIGKGQELHADIARKGLETDHVVGNALVDMYAQCGSLAEAREAFDKLQIRNEVSWTALMAGYAQKGESEIVFHMLERMRAEGIKPDGVTFSIVLTVCSHTGLVNTGQKYFQAMSKDDGITRTIEHHIGMVDLLGRAGQLYEALAMVKKLPFDPTLAVWHTVLGACRKWGNLELGRLAFEQAVHLDEKAAAAYVLMSNIYADVHLEE